MPSAAAHCCIVPLTRGVEIPIVLVAPPPLPIYAKRLQPLTKASRWIGGARRAPDWRSWSCATLPQHHFLG